MTGGDRARTVRRARLVALWATAILGPGCECLDVPAIDGTALNAGMLVEYEHRNGGRVTVEVDQDDGTVFVDEHGVPGENS